MHDAHPPWLGRHGTEFGRSDPRVPALGHVQCRIQWPRRSHGRGSFTETFPLFGFKLDQYETLFEDKLDLFAALASQQEVSWSGATRPPLVNQRVYPPIEAGTLKTWIGVGGSPESVLHAVRYDLPLMLAIIGGDPERFKPYVDLYHRAFAQIERPVKPIGVHSPGYVAATDKQAREEL